MPPRTGLLVELGITDCDDDSNAGGSVPINPKRVQYTLVDFLTRYRTTIGIPAELIRRAREGGSYKVSVNVTLTWTRCLCDSIRSDMAATKNRVLLITYVVLTVANKITRRVVYQFIGEKTNKKSPNE